MSSPGKILLNTSEAWNASRSFLDLLTVNHGETQISDPNRFDAYLNIPRTIVESNRIAGILDHSNLRTDDTYERTILHGY